MIYKIQKPIKELIQFINGLFNSAQFDILFTV